MKELSIFLMWGLTDPFEVPIKGPTWQKRKLRKPLRTQVAEQAGDFG